MNLPFENKVALVTGVASGIELVAARACAETGAAVFWLRSPVASFVISHALVVDGSNTAR